MSEAAFLESSEIAVLGKSQAASLEASKMAFPGASEAASICSSVVIVICNQNADPIKFGPARTFSNSLLPLRHLCGIGYGALNVYGRDGARKDAKDAATHSLACSNEATGDVTARRSRNWVDNCT